MYGCIKSNLTDAPLTNITLQQSSMKLTLWNVKFLVLL